MNDNPYQSPMSIEPRSADPPGRRATQIALRLALVICLLPAAYNYYAFDARYIAGSGIPAKIATLYRLTNLTSLVLGAGAVWWLGLPALELVAGNLRKLLARRTEQDAWLEALYRSLRPIAWLALPAAILWAVWVAGIYYLGAPVFLISWSVGLLCHLLGACLYVPLVCRWCRLAWQAGRHGSP